MAKTTGSRPKPRVATGASPTFKTGTGASFNGKRASKTPTGSRPRPPVAKDSMPGSSTPGRPSYPKQTPMPAPNMKAGTRVKDKGHGG